MEKLGFLTISPVALISLKKERDFLSINAPFLKEVHLDITSRCNLNCLHCYQNSYLQAHIKEMQTSEIKALIDCLTEINVASLVISGGEPFLRTDLWDIIKYAFKKGIIVPTIFTNGTVYNDDLKKICRCRKPIYFAISLDGPNSDTHDFIRGDGAFKRTMENINFILKEQKMGGKTEIVINTMIHPLNFNFLQEMFLFGMKVPPISHSGPSFRISDYVGSKYSIFVLLN